MKVVLCCIVIIFLAGCEVFEHPRGKSETIEAIKPSTDLCESEPAREQFYEFCKLGTWTAFLIEAEKTPWQTRMESIKLLGDEPYDKLQKILLSQAVDTPYTNRLRAQNWFDELKERMEAPMYELARVIVEIPSQQMLELESAITILSRVNARQERTINELQRTLEARQAEMKKQQEQVEQLLKIEASMSDDKRSN
uniref:SlyX family protein n=1 Tax=Ningiella ruwaisensis TaxID=2364274 RepID=UPI00109F0450|nr:SlyX family protein [Ningiella ruwaisensis]